MPRRPAFLRDLLCEVILLVPPQRHNATKLLTCDNTEAGTEPERAGHVAKAVGSFVGSELVAGPLKGQVVVQKRTSRTEDGRYSGAESAI